MNQSSKHVYESRTSRETRRIEGDGQFKGYQQYRQVSSHSPHELVVRSYNFPTEISFQDLVNRRNVLHQLMHEFESNKGDRVVFDPYKSEDYLKRLFLLENQIEGLMRTGMIYEGGEGKASIDYGNLINQKQNQINELERKISHYEANYRKHDHRVKQLQDEIMRLHSVITEKNRLIEHMEGRNVREWGSNQDAHGYADRLVGELERFKKNSSASFGMLDGLVQAWILKLPQSSGLKAKLKAAETRILNQRKYRDYVMNKLSQVSRLYKSQINEVSSKVGSSARIGYDDQILRALSIDDGRKDPIFESVFAGYIGGGADYDKYQRDMLVSRTVQVPVQDARTKALIYKLAKQMNRIYKKYPSLSKQIDPRLAEFFSQQMLQVIEVDQVDRLIQIVKIQPQVVKVDNVYAYSSQKSRKVEFHLRVLIKALLEEMEKMKARTGISPQIDEGVIGMIRQQIMDVVDVDDILKVYRTVPKIVQVQKVIEKVVQKIVQVPRYVTAETKIQVPVEVNKVSVVQNTVNVPVQHPVVTNIIQQKIVEVPQIINNVVATPQIHEKVIEKVVQRPQVVKVDNVITLEKEVPKIVEVPGPQRIVEVPKTQVVQCIKEVIVETRQEIEKIKQVQKVIEKVVQVVKEVPKIVEVQKIVQKTVPIKQYIENQRIINHIAERFEPVQVVRQKIVPVVKVEQRIVQVPQIIQKIIPTVEVRTQIVEVKVLQEKPMIQKELQVVEKIKEVPVVEIREVEKIVQKIVEIPVVHEKVIVEKQYIKEPVVETVEKIIHKEVQLQKPVIMYQDKIVEVDRVINHVVQVPQVINIEKETLVPYQKVINNVVAEPTIVQKVIQKIVEVPKVVEVQKIVEKIVPVPRVVEKVVEVQKIVQKIVKQLVVQEKIVEKQYRVQVPVFQDRLVEVQKPVNYYQKVQVPKQVRQEVMVKDTVTHTVPEIRQITQPPKIVVETREVQVPMVVQKICTLRATDNKYIQLKQTQIIPVEIQLPVDIIKQKIVPIQHVVPEVQVQKAIQQKIVQVEVQPEPQVVEVQSIVQKLKVQKQIQVVENRVPYYQDKIIQVEVMVQKIIQPVYYEVEKIVQIPTFIDKIVEKVNNIPKIYEIQKRNDVVVKDPVIVPFERIVPKLVTLNKSIENIVDRIVEVPRLLQKLQVVDQVHQKIVPQTEVQTRIEQVRTIQEKEVIIEKIKEVQNTINCVSEVLKTAERVIEKPTDPIIVCEDKVMQVPFIVQKIVQKIVVMPQVVEVLKYVHELVDNQAMLTSQEAVVQDAEYTNLARNVNLQVTKLKSLLNNLRPQSAQYRKQVAIIENFLAEFNKFIAFPRIREIINEKKVDNIIQKDRIVRVPIHNSEDEQRNLASAVLIDKLINQLRRFKQTNPNMKWQLDQDILQIFGAQLEPISKYYGNDYNKVLDEYVKAVHNRFSSVGPWSSDHQIMLKSFIQERFDLAYNYKKASSDSAKSRARYQSVLQSFGKMKEENERMRKSFEIFNGLFPAIVEEGRKQNRIDQRTQNQLNQAFRGINEIIVGITVSGGASTERLKPLENERFHSMLREKQQQIIRLKDQIKQLMMDKSCTTHRHTWQEVGHSLTSGAIEGDSAKFKETIRDLQRRNRELENEIRRLRTLQDQHRKCGPEMDSLKAQISRLRLDVSNLRSPKESRGTKHSFTSPKEQDRQRQSSDSSSFYGQNFQEYANNLQDGQNKVYRSGSYGGTERSGNYNANQYATQYAGTTSKQSISSNYSGAANIQGGGNIQGSGNSEVSGTGATSTGIATNSKISGYGASGASGAINGSGAGGLGTSGSISSSMTGGMVSGRTGGAISTSQTGGVVSSSSSRTGGAIIANQGSQGSNYQSGYKRSYQGGSNGQGGYSYQSIQMSRGVLQSGDNLQATQARYQYSEMSESNYGSSAVKGGMGQGSSSTQRQIYDSKKASYR